MPSTLCLNLQVRCSWYNWYYHHRQLLYLFVIVIVLMVEVSYCTRVYNTHVYYCCAAEQERLSEFELKLMDIDSEHLGIPENEYEATVTLPSSEFQRICRDLSSIGEAVEISVTKDAVKFATNGDIGNANVLCRPHKSSDSEECIEISINEPVALTFALRYLNTFAKATPLAPNVVLKMSKELPIVVEYHLPDQGDLKFYLAPKVDDMNDE